LPAADGLTLRLLLVDPDAERTRAVDCPIPLPRPAGEAFPRLAFSGDGRILAVAAVRPPSAGEPPGVVCFFDTAAAEKRRLPLPDRPGEAVTAVALTPDGGRAAVLAASRGDTDVTLHVWDVRAGRETRSLPLLARPSLPPVESSRYWREKAQT